MRGRTIHLETPSRLHFGLLSFGRRSGRQFGGVGVMIARPALRLRVSESEKLEADGPSASRAIQFARRAAQCLGGGQHVGLGVGTQLGMAVAAGVAHCCTGEVPDTIELARAVGRGLRSAVGVHGFAHGGLIYEGGKAADEKISPLVEHASLPDAWRFVLVRPHEQQGLSGDRERHAFESLPPVEPETTDALRREIETRLVPAAAAGCFEKFSESVFRYGRKAGECFAACQGGPYASPRLASLVEAIRSLGVEGVGRSSWGPTLFALLPDESQANDFVGRLRRLPVARDCHTTISPPANHGVRLSTQLQRDEATIDS